MKDAVKAKEWVDMMQGWRETAQTLAKLLGA
jgi:hypothetical protein